MIAFDATYDEAGAAHAERAFYVRSVLELRRWQTFGPPCFFAAMIVVAWWLGVWSGFFALFSTFFFVLTVVGPVFFYVARPISAGRLARKYPVRHVSLTQEGLEVTAGDQKAAIVWPSVRHIWQSGDYMLLVLDRYANISIPCRSLPSGAYEVIRASAKRAT